MKASIIALFVFFGFILQGQNLELYGRYTPGQGVVPDVSVYGTKSLKPKGLSLCYFLLVEPKWAEALVGITYAPKPWVELGFFAGIEQNKPLYRCAGSLWLGKGNGSFQGLWEKGLGKGNYWYKITAAYQVSLSFSIGLRAWRFHGIGPIFTYSIPKSPCKIWVMTGFNTVESDAQKSAKIIFGMDIDVRSLFK